MLILESRCQSRLLCWFISSLVGVGGGLVLTSPRVAAVDVPGVRAEHPQAEVASVSTVKELYAVVSRWVRTDFQPDAQLTQFVGATGMPYGAFYFFSPSTCQKWTVSVGNIGPSWGQTAGQAYTNEFAIPSGFRDLAEAIKAVQQQAKKTLQGATGELKSAQLLDGTIRPVWIMGLTDPTSQQMSSYVVDAETLKVLDPMQIRAAGGMIRPVQPCVPKKPPIVEACPEIHTRLVGDAAPPPKTGTAPSRRILLKGGISITVPITSGKIPNVTTECELPAYIAGRPTNPFLDYLNGMSKAIANCVVKGELCEVGWAAVYSVLPEIRIPETLIQTINRGEKVEKAVLAAKLLVDTQKLFAEKLGLDADSYCVGFAVGELVCEGIDVIDPESVTEKLEQMTKMRTKLPSPLP